MKSISYRTPFLLFLKFSIHADFDPETTAASLLVGKTREYPYPLFAFNFVVYISPPLFCLKMLDRQILEACKHRRSSWMSEI